MRYLITISPQEDPSRTHAQYNLLKTNLNLIQNTFRKYLKLSSAKTLWSQESGKDHPHYHAYLIGEEPITKLSNAKRDIINHFNKTIMKDIKILDPKRFLNIKIVKRDEEVDRTIGYVVKENPIIIIGYESEYLETCKQKWLSYQSQKQSPHSNKKITRINEAYLNFLDFLTTHYQGVELDTYTVSEEFRYIMVSDQITNFRTKEYEIKSYDPKYFYIWRSSIAKSMGYLTYTKLSPELFSKKAYEDREPTPESLDQRIARSKTSTYF